MAILPRAPYPHTPVSEGLTPKRLWVLFRGFGFDRHQVAALTGTTFERVRDALTENGIVRSKLLHPTVVDIRVLWDLAERLGVPPAREQVVTEWQRISTELCRRHLREAVASGRVPWSAIDALPPVYELGKGSRLPTGS